MTKSLEIADWSDILRVLRETFEIWSPGLSREMYINFIRMQLKHRWPRQNYSYLILRDAFNSKTPAASLKYYTIHLQHRGKAYKFAGLGAIYTRKDMRGLGYATDLIKKTLDRAWYDGCHGAILFSDIGSAYYSRIGFFDVNNERFVLQLTAPKREEGRRLNSQWSIPLAGSNSPGIFSQADSTIDDTTDATITDSPDWRARYLVEEDTIVTTRYLTSDAQTVDFVTRHYARWLRKQPYGFVRDDSYFHFKILRENYLARHSSLSWPKLELMTVESGNTNGYAIIEHGGRVVRILELVGDGNTRRLLWRGIIARARDLDAIRISGWEGVLADFSPGFSLNQTATIDSAVFEESNTLMFADKSKGRTMILPFFEEIEDWLTVCPCPILELDQL